MDGLLSRPVSSFEVTDQGTRFLVFLYQEASITSGAHFAHASLVLQQLGEPEPVYYAPQTLPQAPPEGAFVEYLSPDDLNPIERVPPGKYSMWYATTEQPKLTDSVTLGYIRRAYEAAAGYEPRVLYVYLRQFEMVDASTGPGLLPDELLLVPVNGPEHRPLLMSASREKGIRFHFRDDTPVLYRDAFWKLYATFCEMLRERLVEKGVPTVGDEEGALNWFNLASAFILDSEAKGNPAQMFGTIPVE